MRVLLVLVVVLALGAGVVGLAATRDLGPFAQEAGAQERNVFAERALFVDPGARTLAAVAQLRADGREADADLLARMAEVPTGIWLVPEQLPPGSVGPFVTSLATAAEEAEEVPVLVLYGIPGRDCSGGYSAGGLDKASYRPWVQEVADAVVAAEATVAVVVEPDALASSLECDLRAERVELVGRAVDTLVAAGITTYLDAGHSDWVSASAMAQMLEEVGIDRVRGFATNVSNYQTDEAERAYAERLSDLVGGSHWVVDRGRNGNGATDEWCNPPGRALGQLPGFVEDGSGLDAYLWVKPPAESDGTCGGGPPAGEIYLDQAVSLARAAGW